METREHGHLSTYRRRLLEALRELPRRRRREDPGSFQVFVNHQGVGTLACDGGNATFVSMSHRQPIEVVEVRTASGLLVGALGAPAIGRKGSGFRAGSYTVQLSVDNGLEGGSVTIEARAAVSLPIRAWRAMASVFSSVPPLGRPETRTAPAADRLPSALQPGWARTFAAAQIVLAAAAVLLVADQLSDRGLLPAESTTAVTPSENRELLQRQERLLAAVAQNQEAVLAALRVQEQRLEENSQAGMRQSREGEQLRGEVVLLTRQNQRLSRELTVLESRNRDLERSVREQAVALARAVAPIEESKPVAAKAPDVHTGPAPLPPQVAAVRPQPAEPVPPHVAGARKEAAEAMHPFTFWVSFEDGTPETSIQQLITDIHGRRGPTNSGWSNVEVNLKDPETPDNFFKSLRKVKIVKAVTTKLNTPPAQ